MVSEIVLRSAKMQDSDLLLSWRNDEETRANSFRSGIVKKEDHIEWIKKVLGGDSNLLLIAECDGKPVGAFRLDKFTVAETGEVPDMRLISYVVAPEWRRRGIGKAIVAEGCVCYGQSYGLIARIKASNVASQKILEACDFQLLGEVDEGIIAYVRPTEKEETLQ